MAVSNARQGNKLEKLKRLRDFLKSADSYRAEIGFFDSRNAVKAYVSEFGGISGGAAGLKGKVIPPRPFMRPAVKALGRKASLIFARGIVKAYKSGGSPKAAFEEVGEAYLSAIRDNIEALTAPKLSGDSTIPLRRRGGLYRDPALVSYSEKPLIHTGELINSLACKVAGKDKAARGMSIEA